MKNTVVALSFFSALLIGYLSTSTALALDLTNGGLGQAAANPQQFGVAVCDNDAQTLTSAVPINITVGDQSTTISSAASIASGQCEYSYLPYSQLGMQGGQTYSVNVTVGDDETTYNVTVPPQPTVSLSADISKNVSGLISKIWNWFVGLFKYL